jgi:protein-tyrosine phosphatase
LRNIAIHTAQEFIPGMLAALELATQFYKLLCFGCPSISLCTLPTSFAEPAAWRAAGIEFKSFPIQDREVPPLLPSFAAFVERLRAELHSGRSVAVHCRASIGRSSLLLAGVLCAEGFQPEGAFKRLAKARELQVPDTDEQVQWIQRFAEGWFFG